MENRLLEGKLSERYVNLLVISPDADLTEVVKTLLDSDEDMVIVNKGEHAWGYIGF